MGQGYEDATKIGPCRVLVIEDNALNLKLCRMVLEAAGHEVLLAEDAEAGLSMARRTRPDIVLMDIQLPGISGLEATRRFKADPALAAIPVMALTAHALAVDRSMALAAGCCGYITKPIDVASFADEVSLAVSRSWRGLAGHVSANASRALLAADDAASLAPLAATLRGDNHDVITTSSGHDVVEKAVLEAPDVIVIDAAMRGLDGFELTRRLKSSRDTSGIPVVLMIPADDSAQRRRVLDAGADDIVNKPVYSAELVLRVESLVRARRYRDRLGGTVNGRASTSSLVLYVELGSADDRRLRGELAALGHEVRQVGSVSAALAAVAERRWDLVVVGSTTELTTARELLAALAHAPFRAPVLLVATAATVEMLIPSLVRGRDDILLAPLCTEELGLRVRALLDKKRMRDELVAQARALGDAGPNADGSKLYEAFAGLLEGELARARVRRYPLSLALADIGDVEAHAPDQTGPPASVAARALREELRCTDVCMPLSSRLMAIILPYTGTSEAHRMLERVRRVLGPFASDAGLSDPPIGAVTLAPGWWHADAALASCRQTLDRAIAGAGPRTVVASFAGPIAEPSGRAVGGD